MTHHAFVNISIFVLRRLLPKFLKPKLGTFFQHKPRSLKSYEAQYCVEKTAKTSNKITIVTPSYQQGRFIEKTIKSVFAQNYSNLEYIVQDGCSHDNTLDILKKYSNKICWASSPDQGQTHALNLAFEKSSGEIMAYLNSDDLLLPNTLDIVSEFFEKHPDCDVVYGNRLVIDENDKVIGRWVLPKHSVDVIPYVDYIPQETMFWRRRIWDAIGGKLDESYNFAMDWDLILRFHKAKANFVHLPKFLGCFRVYSGQKTSTDIATQGAEEMKRLRIRELGDEPSYLTMTIKLFPYLVRHLLEDFKYRRF